MKTLACRDAGFDCDHVIKGETEEEVMRNAKEHGMREHGETEEHITQMKEKLRGLIRSS